MAKVLIVGAGFAGHTAAIYLGNKLGQDHEITMINKFNYFLYLPSLIWVGIGRMSPAKLQVSLKPVYDRINVNFVHGAAKEVHPDENFVLVNQADGNGLKRLDYDYLLMATGPKLNWEGTSGLGPMNGYTQSVCWLGSAVQTSQVYHEHLERMRRGERVKFVIGMGHPESTCQGAAFEYLMNVHCDLIKLGLRDKAELLWLSNEPALGDFGVGGVNVRKEGSARYSEDFIRDIFKRCDIEWEIKKGVKGVDEDHIYWEDYSGESGETEYDFAMMIPQFTGVEMKYIGKDGDDISGKVTNKAGFVLVDGFYGLPYESLLYTPEAWPAIYQNPTYRNIFAAGIAFAPPGPISVPHVTPNGTNITAAPPRTGMVSGIIGRLVAKNIISLINDGQLAFQERMTEMFTTCIASMDHSLWRGSAVSVVVFPVVPNLIRFPNQYGRDESITHLERGLSSAWIKRIIHSTMIYKMRSRSCWQIIPE